LGNFDIAVTCTVLVVLMVITFAGVLFRYVLNKPLTWMEEVQLMCMVWIVYGAAGAAFRTHTHVAIEIIVDTLPRAARRIVQVIISIVVTCVASYLFIQSIGYVQLFIMNDRSSSMLHIPYKYVYGVVPVSCVLMVANYFFSLFSSYKRSEPKEEGSRE
jgi:TRAP-type C4-dicarboxylate transport system permease small subunit